MAFGRQVADTERRYLYALRLVLLLRYKSRDFLQRHRVRISLYRLCTSRYPWWKKTDHSVPPDGIISGVY